MDWLVDIFTAAFNTDSETAAIIVRSFFGLAILALASGIAWLLAKVGEGGGSLIDSVGQGLGGLLQGIGMLPAGIGDAIKSTGHGVDEFLSTPKAMVTKAAEVEVARINAARESFDLQVTDGRRSVGLKLSGTGANRAAKDVVDSISGPSRAVFGPSVVRVLTDTKQTSGDDE